eukprot:3934353-Rhodomonas_salina.7
MRETLRYQFRGVKRYPKSVGVDLCVAPLADLLGAEKEAVGRLLPSRGPLRKERPRRRGATSLIERPT